MKKKINVSTKSTNGKKVKIDSQNFVEDFIIVVLKKFFKVTKFLSLDKKNCHKKNPEIF